MSAYVSPTCTIVDLVGWVCMSMPSTGDLRLWVLQAVCVCVYVPDRRCAFVGLVGGVCVCMCLYMSPTSDLRLWVL